MANIALAYQQLATAIAGNASSAALDDIKSSYIVGTSPLIVSCNATGTSAYLVMVFLPDAVGTVSMTINGVTITNTSTSQANVIGYGGGKYLAYYGVGNTTSISITGLTGLKISKILVANYISLKYNIAYGDFSAGYNDESSLVRSQAGDSLVSSSIRYKELSVDLSQLADVDKFAIYRIAKDLGKTKGLFISVFPGDKDKDKEELYSCYGRLNSAAPISQQNFLLYNTNLSLQEI